MVPDDRQIEAAARRLGDDAAARVDPQRVAWAVSARLRREGRRSAWWLRARLAPLAAAAAVIAAVGLGIHEYGNHGTPVGDDLPVSATLSELVSSELSEVLDSLASEAPVSELVTPTLADLNETELAALLKAMEG
jgi:negative regulator of sigma E activity